MVIGPLESISKLVIPVVDKPPEPLNSNVPVVSPNDAPVAPLTLIVVLASKSVVVLESNNIGPAESNSITNALISTFVQQSLPTLIIPVESKSIANALISTFVEAWRCPNVIVLAVGPLPMLIFPVCISVPILIEFSPNASIVISPPEKISKLVIPVVDKPPVPSKCHTPIPSPNDAPLVPLILIVLVANKSVVVPFTLKLPDTHTAPSNSVVFSLIVNVLTSVFTIVAPLSKVVVPSNIPLLIVLLVNVFSVDDRYISNVSTDVCNIIPL